MQISRKNKHFFNFNYVNFNYTFIEVGEKFHTIFFILKWIKFVDRKLCKKNI